MDVPTQRPVPDREFFRIGEIADLLGVPPSAVRFWKEQFGSHVRPRKTQSLQNVFSRRDLSVLALVRHLSHDLRLSMRDTKDRLSELLGQHNGDIGFIHLVHRQPELALGGGIGEEDGAGVRDAEPAAESRGFLAQLDELRADLLAARAAASEADSRAAMAERERDRAKAETAAMMRRIRQSMRELASEAGED